MSALVHVSMYCPIACLHNVLRGISFPLRVRVGSPGISKVMTAYVPLTCSGLGRVICPTHWVRNRPNGTHRKYEESIQRPTNYLVIANAHRFTDCPAACQPNVVMRRAYYNPPAHVPWAMAFRALQWLYHNVQDEGLTPARTPS